MVIPEDSREKKRLLRAGSSCWSISNEFRWARPYKPSYGHQTTCGITTEGDGKTLLEHFAPAVLATFTKIAPAFAEIFDPQP